MAEVVPVDEAPGELQVGGGRGVRLQLPAAARVGGVEGVLEVVVHEVEGDLVGEVDVRLDQDVVPGMRVEAGGGDDAQAEGVRAEPGLDDIAVRGRQPVQVGQAVDGRDHRVPGGGQVEEVLLAGHVRLAGERVVHAAAAFQGPGAEVVVGLLVAEDRAAVADDDGVVAVQQGRRVQRMAQGEVEVGAQPGGEEDVLVAVAAPAGLVRQVGDVEDAGASGHAGLLGRRWGRRLGRAGRRKVTPDG